jgi:hypothetical protein
MTESGFALAQLRHAYQQLADGLVKDQKAFADGLIAPAIRSLEMQASKEYDETPEDREVWGLSTKDQDYLITQLMGTISNDRTLGEVRREMRAILTARGVK